MKTVKSFTKWSLVIASLTTLLVACGKKDDGGGTTNVYNPCANTYNGQIVNGVSCINGNPVYQNSAGSLLNNVQFTSSYIQGVMNIGALNSMNGGMNIDFSSPYVYAYYSGPMTVAGSMTVLQQLCSAPAGQYTIVSTSQAGQFNMGVISNLNITATGPANIQLMGTYMTSQVYNPQGLSRDASGNRIGLNAQLVVNGQSCGAISTY